MRDALGRTINYARISITDRCNLRCRYCMPEEGVPKLRHANILTFDEITRVCRCLVGLGIDQFKITGGEPLIRKGAAGLVGMIKAIPGVRRVAMTTNGLLLAAAARALRDAGLDGVNISLDTLDPDRYRELTRGGDVADVLSGLDAALAEGFDTVKLNCVPVAGRPDGDVTAVAALARTRKAHIRFIEMMPLGCGVGFTPLRGTQVRALLEEAFGPLAECPAPPGCGPARYYALEGFLGRIGFVDSLSHTQCGTCNRVRLTPEGVLKGCLHMDAGQSLKSALAHDGDGLLQATARNVILTKPARHRFTPAAHTGPERRGMSEIGG